jgi:MoaA/NifB/PqqE/SkfB family radical SAM enzyme
MRIQDSQFLFDKLFSGPRFSPVSGHVDLTYRCNLRCVHCYCQGAANVRDELSSRQWFEILDAIHAQGCLWLDLSGGEPLLREDFLDIYAYTKAKGILPIILTNGQLFDRKIIAALKKRPPYAIEITLNGITAGVYESITRIPGSFEKVTEKISRIVKAGLPLRLKANCLKQNKQTWPQQARFSFWL